MEQQEDDRESARIRVLLVNKFTEIAHAITEKFASPTKNEEDRKRYGDVRPPPDFLLKDLYNAFLPAIRDMNLIAAKYIFIGGTVMPLSTKQKKLRFAMLKQFETEFTQWAKAEGHPYQLYFEGEFMFPKGAPLANNILPVHELKYPH